MSFYSVKTICCLGTLLLLSASAEAANHYVRQGATGNGSGADWTHAFTTLSATDSENANSDDISIRVYPEGTVNQAIWNGRNTQGQMVASGTYLVILKKGNEIHKRKVVVVK